MDWSCLKVRHMAGPRIIDKGLSRIQTNFETFDLQAGSFPVPIWRMCRFKIPDINVRGNCLETPSVIDLQLMWSVAVEGMCRSLKKPSTVTAITPSINSRVHQHIIHLVSLVVSLIIPTILHVVQSLQVYEKQPYHTSILLGVGNGTGNPAIFWANPHPYPRKPVPMTMVAGFGR